MSNASQVLTQPVVRAAFFDGTDVHVMYVPSLNAVTGYQLKLNRGSPIPEAINPDPSKGWATLKNVQFFSGAQMALTFGLAPNQGNYPFGQVPATTINFPRDTPVLTVDAVARFRDGRLWARWAPPPPGSDYPIDGYLLLLRDADSGATDSRAIIGLSSTTGELVSGLPAGIGNALEFRLLALNEKTAAGAATTPLPVIGAAASAVRVAIGTSAIEVWWQPSADPAASQHTPWLYAIEDGWSNGSAGQAERDGYGSIPIAALDPNKQWRIAVIAGTAAGAAVAAVSEAVAVPLQKPALRQVRAEAGLLAVSISSDTDSGPMGACALVRALSAGGEIARGTASEAPLALSVDPAKVDSLTWRQANDGQLGPEQTLTLNLKAPATPSISSNPITGQSLLQWSAIAGATGYEIELYPGAAAIALGAVTEYLLPSGLMGVSQLSARVWATFLAGNVQILGLASTALGPLPAAPVDLEADYDGSIVRARWSPLTGVDGYELSVYARGESQTTTKFNAAASQSHCEFPLPAGSTIRDWQLVIQSVRGRMIGPASGALDLVAAGWYIQAPESGRPVGSAALAPVDGAASLNAFQSGQGNALSWALPALGTSALQTPLPSNGSFTLAAGSGAWPYELQIPASSALWQFDGTALRNRLLEDLPAFLLALEKANAEPWGLDLVQRVIARGAPLTFEETLYVEYGLTGPNSKQRYGSFDLRPGMQLRVQAPGYLNLDPDLSGALLNGFAPGASIDFDIGVDSSSGWRPTLDAFFARLVAQRAIRVLPPPTNDDGSAEGGGADAADLAYQQLMKSFLRVLVPAQLLSATSGGSTTASEQFLIVAADSYRDLLSITSPPGSNTAYAYFRGRAVLQARIRIEVNGNPETVAIGTRVADLLRAWGALPAFAPAALEGLSLIRRLGACQSSPEIPADPSAALPVVLSWDGLGDWGQAANVLELPLLAGDQLWFS
ncbi:MAG: hypothetical protein AB7E72_01220 [Lysobacterales bacterium]